MDYSDARPSYFNLFTEPRRMLLGWNPVGAASGCMQSGAAVEASSRRKRGAAAEADVIGGQADAIGEQQLCTDSCPAPDYSW